MAASLPRSAGNDREGILMTPEEILKHDARVLTQAQREAYFDTGYVSGEGLIRMNGWTRSGRRRTSGSRPVVRAESGSEFDLAPEHTSESPHVRRLKSPVDQHPVFRKFAVRSPFADIAADLVGPNVKFHSCKINYKHPGGGEVVKWHQDICFWPHTNYSPVTLGFYLDGCEEAQGPLTVIPESHKGDLFPHYDDDGIWTGTVPAKDMATLPLDTAAGPTGDKGTVLALNCRTVHGSKRNETDRVRPILLYVYTSADGPWGQHPSSTFPGEIIRGEAAKFPHMDPRSCPSHRIGQARRLRVTASQEKGDAGNMIIDMSKQHSSSAAPGQRGRYRQRFIDRGYETSILHRYTTATLFRRMSNASLVIRILRRPCRRRSATGVSI